MITDIIYPALALGVIALFFGGLLAFASIVFKVEKDERIDKIAEILPGANCGGCGYAGCSALADAIITDGVSPSMCNLMNEETAEKISKITGKSTQTVEKHVARVMCLGTCDKCADKYDFYGIEDCYTASQLAGGPKSCEYGCMGLGSCKNVCTFGAIEIVDGIANIDEEKCTGCGNCEKICPKNVISLIPKKNTVYAACSSKDKGTVVKSYCSQGCIGCKICEKKCPNGAITVVDNLAAIDYTKCTNCGICADSCPKKIIVKV